ncbi:MAG: transporter [Vicinamibacterales bacterium]
MSPRLAGMALASLVVVCAHPSTLLARQAEGTSRELVTDRPDFTESSTVVGRGVWQLESGFSFESDGRGTDRARAITTPQVLLRLGLSDWTELRLGSDGLVSEQLPGVARHTGAADLDVAAKIELAHADSVGFDLALIPSVSLPTGSAGVSSDRVDTGVKFTWSRDLARGFAVSGNLNTAALGDASGQFAQHSMSVSLARDLVAGFGGYWEVYGFSALERGGTPAWTFNTGLTHPLGPDAQLDVTVGRGLSAAAPDYFISGGISVRGLWSRR